MTVGSSVAPCRTRRQAGVADAAAASCLVQVCSYASYQSGRDFAGWLTMGLRTGPRWRLSAPWASGWLWLLTDVGPRTRAEPPADSRPPLPVLAQAADEIWVDRKRVQGMADPPRAPSHDPPEILAGLGRPL